MMIMVMISLTDCLNLKTEPSFLVEELLESFLSFFWNWEDRSTFHSILGVAGVGVC